MKRKQPSRFTLIEAIFLIVIVGILGTLTIIFGIQKREEARRLACQNNLKKIKTALYMYSSLYAEKFPDRNGRAGLQQLDYLFWENLGGKLFMCPSTNDVVEDLKDIHIYSSYAYAGGFKENNVDKAFVSDRANNHKKYGNILFVNKQIKGYSGANWSSNFGGSVLVDFK